MTLPLMPLSVLFDSREQTPWEPLPGVTMTRATLDAGDYTTEALQGVAVLERKSIPDFASTITRDRERFEDELRRLRNYRWRSLIVEGDITEVYRVTVAHPHSILGTVASLTARWDCPVIFAGDRTSAARVGFGILRRWEQRLQADQQGPANG
jgi:ERCC4-type nuclease